MIIDNVLIIPDDGIENFTLSLAQDGIAWEDLTVTVTIQLQTSALLS